MQMRQFEVQNLPSTFAGRDPTYHWSPSSDDSSATPSSPSSESWDHASRGGSTRANRRRRKGSKKDKKTQNSTSPPHDKPMTKNDIYFALDCEMVGVGPEGLDSAVARVTLCNWAEKVILDTFVQVPVKVTDYRTFVSGIEAKDLESETAMPLAEVRNAVQSILHGKILIGHALENDLAALCITHPWHDIRDTANYPPFMKEIRDADSDRSILRPRKLKELTRDRLGRDIQAQGKAHNPVEDARAALRLYKSERLEWEQTVVRNVASAREQEIRDREPTFVPNRASFQYYGQPDTMATRQHSISNFHRRFDQHRATSSPRQGFAHHVHYNFNRPLMPCP